MKTLYGCAVGFTENGPLSGSSAEGIRSRKSELLARFMREGYFLIDASEVPMPEGASSSQKLALLRASDCSIEGVRCRQKHSHRANRRGDLFRLRTISKESRIQCN